MNYIYLRARVETQPQIAHLRNGSTVAKLQVKEDEKILWYCDAFNHAKDLIANLQKGDEVSIDGSILTEIKTETTSSGKEYSKRIQTIRIHHIALLNRPIIKTDYEVKMENLAKAQAEKLNQPAEELNLPDLDDIKMPF